MIVVQATKCLVFQLDTSRPLEGVDNGSSGFAGDIIYASYQRGKVAECWNPSSSNQKNCQERRNKRDLQEKQTKIFLQIRRRLSVTYSLSFVSSRGGFSGNASGGPASVISLNTDATNAASKTG